MNALLQKYEKKLVDSGLTAAGTALFGLLDDELIWSRKDPATGVLAGVFDRLSINSLLFAPAADPYRTIIDFLTADRPGAVEPEDCETRTFLHRLPVAGRFDVESISTALRTHKSVIVAGRGIVTTGTVSPEQAFVSFSSVCFACYVKFFADYLKHLRRGQPAAGSAAAMARVRAGLDPPHCWRGRLSRGPFQNESAVRRAMAEAGRQMVGHRLVDSYFGNISYLWDDTVFISQSGSSLDELEGCVDACPLDGRSCAGITASSEFSAHRHIMTAAGCRAILHGHPKFTVVLSMDCEDESCEHRGQCHRRCPRQRSACGIPIVSGEVGRGAHGLWKTVPAAIVGRPGVIVHGHGLFTTGAVDFNRPFQNLVDIENRCREEYFRRVDELAGKRRG